MKSNRAFKEHANLLNAPQLHPNTSSGAAQRSVPVNGRRIGLSDWSHCLGSRAGFENKITPFSRQCRARALLPTPMGLGPLYKKCVIFFGAYTKQMLLVKMPHGNIVRILLTIHHEDSTGSGSYHEHNIHGICGGMTSFLTCSLCVASDGRKGFQSCRLGVPFDCSKEASFKPPFPHS